MELLQDGYQIDPSLAGNYERLDDKLDERVALEGHQFKYLSLLDAIKFGDQVKLIEGNCLVFRDGDHLSVCGEKVIGAVLSKKLISRVYAKG